jgi:hypothetical protein
VLTQRRALVSQARLGSGGSLRRPKGQFFVIRRDLEHVFSGLVVWSQRRKQAHHSGARPPVLGIVDGESRQGMTYQGQLRTIAAEVKSAADTMTAIKKTFGIEEPIKEPPRAYAIALVSPGGLSGRSLSVLAPPQQLRTPRQLTWPIGLAHREIGTAWPWRRTPLAGGGIHRDAWFAAPENRQPYAADAGRDH